MSKTAAKNAVAMVVFAIIVATVILARQKWLASSHQGELNTQWEVLAGAFAEDTYASLALHNVWGNVMVAEFYPFSKGARPLAEMRGLTDELNNTILRTQGVSPAERADKIYAVLASCASDSEFVRRYRESDLTVLQGRSAGSTSL